MSRPLKIIMWVVFILISDFRATVDAILAERPPAGEPKEVELSLLVGIEYEEGGPVPKEVQELDGLRVKIEGFMAPITVEGSPTFLMVTAECDCTGRPKVQHFIQVRVKEPFDFRSSQVTVVGKLSVGAEYDGDFITSLYRLRAESVH